MTTPTRDESAGQGRRDFLKTTAVAAGAALTTTLLPGGAYAAGDEAIKVGIIGCGGRGNGAGFDVLRAAKGVTIVALGDVFKNNLNGCRKDLERLAKDDEDVKKLGNKVEVEGNCHVGLDAYKKVIDTPGLNYVILATPPGFRPLHLQAAINAGKNVFTEKPVAVDGPGYNKVIDAYKEAQKKKLGVGAGTQRRHDAGYLEVMKRVHDGEIGKIVGGRCTWMQGILWARKRREGMSDTAYQIHNWYNFAWLSGDHIVEQHIHNIDVINWAIKSPPVAALGMGFRTRTDETRSREGGKYHNIYDFFAVDYEYPEGVHVLSMARHISGCDGGVGEWLVGTKGKSQPNAYTVNGKRVLKRGREGRASQIQEHTDLIASIRAGKPINELKNVADSTLAAIMGRMSAYTGKRVTWKAAVDSKEALAPVALEKLAWDMKLPEPPLPVPGGKSKRG
jgi:predicted dehydrogenase